MNDAVECEAPAIALPMIKDMKSRIVITSSDFHKALTWKKIRPRDVSSSAGRGPSVSLVHFGSSYTMLNLPVLFGDYAAYGAIVCSCDAVSLFDLSST
jgi:hypothetical protein